MHLHALNSHTHLFTRTYTQKDSQNTHSPHSTFHHANTRPIPRLHKTIKNNNPPHQTPPATIPYKSPQTRLPTTNYTPAHKTNYPKTIHSHTYTNNTQNINKYNIKYINTHKQTKIINNNKN